MHSPSIPGRGIAILAGTALYFASLSALFGDDLIDWSTWTMHHYEVMATSLSTMAFGMLFRAAKRARMWLAMIGFAFLFLAGSWFVVYKSIGRQAAATTTQSMTAEDANKLIADKMADLATSRQRLLDAEGAADHERKGRPDRNGRPATKVGCGDRCKDWERRAEEVRSKVRELEKELRDIGPRQVAAPEAEIFAQIVGIFSGWSVVKVKALAILFVPILWTIFLEFGSIWCIEYGFAGRYPPAATSDIAGKVAVSASLPANSPDDPPKGGRKTSSLPANSKAKTAASNVVYLPGKHPVISALELAGKHLSNEDLAKAMGCCGGEASKRRKEIADLLHQYRQGHCIMVGLKKWQKATA